MNTTDSQNSVYKRGRRDTGESRSDSPKRSRLSREESQQDHGVTPPTRSREDYTVAWICALPIELAAAQAMLDHVHDTITADMNDGNEYTLGNIKSYNIVIACLPSGHYGTNNAAIVANNINRSFPSIDMRFMVGIGGGAPTKVDIRLGDVVVSNEVIQYDFGKTIQDGQFCRTSNATRPPQNTMTAVAKLRANYELHPTKIPGYIAGMIARYPHMDQYAYPGIQDQLFQSTYEHDQTRHHCDNCEGSKLVPRLSRPNKDPKVHYGAVASGNQVMKHGGTRDYWAENDNILCFEMEAAGLMDHFPCLVIRGICDYSDSHKNKQWQRYAAAAAAAYAKELILTIRPKQTLPLTNVQTRSRGGGTIHVSDEQRQTLLRSLRFSQIDSRRGNIKKAHAKTCEWLLCKDEYLDWIDPGKLSVHNGFLWIKGKPGAGKSTLMKFMLRNSQRTMRKVIISFFFHARGENLEKSTIGMYRSLLVQLLEQLPDLQQVFNSLLPASWNSDEDMQWDVENLKELFELAIQNIGESSVTCFIDALDECDENQIRDMVSFFEGLSKVAVSAHTKFYICFSSRHYPHITLNSGLSLILEGQEGHTQDIIDYIQSELKIGQSKLAEEIRTELQEKATGVFMWIVLVVDILNREHDNGHMYALRRRLAEIPGDLHKLFHSILTRDSQNQGELLLCIQWILFAKAPMKPEQLYFAILSGVSEEPIISWDKNEVSVADMKRFILSCSKGLAEVTKSKSSRVQFIHESVRDFLLKEDGLRRIWPDVDNIQGQSHERLKQCCIHYGRAEISHLPDMDMPPQDITAAVQRSVTQQFPLLEYAICNVFYHADKAGGCGISQNDFIHTFQLKAWIKLKNIVEKYEIRRYSPNTRLTYILAEANTPHLLRICPLSPFCIEEKDERYGCPLLAAIANENREAIEEFRGALAASLPPQNRIRAKYAHYKPEEGKLHELGRNFTFSEERSILSHLAAYGDTGLFAFLAEIRQLPLDTQDECDKKSPLSWAVFYNHEQIVKFILTTVRARINVRDTRGWTPLEHAIENDDLAIFKLLVEFGDFEPEDAESASEHMSPLLCAISRHRVSIVELMIDSEKFDLKELSYRGRSPILEAVGRGDYDIARRLIETGDVDLNAGDRDGRTPIMEAVRSGNYAMAVMLLGTGDVDLNAGDCDGRTLFLEAAGNRNYDIARILLRMGGVDMNKPDNSGRIPILEAAQRGQWDMVWILAESGKVDPDPRDSDGKTPLYWAALSDSSPANSTAISALLRTGKVDTCMIGMGGDAKLQSRVDSVLGFASPREHGYFTL